MTGERRCGRNITEHLKGTPWSRWRVRVNQKQIGMFQTKDAAEQASKIAAAFYNDTGLILKIREKKTK